jgi:threonine/homoserine/homoserine lactone efflux protein
VLIDADTLGFLGVALIVVITPGPDMALVTTHALGHGRESARRAAIGVNAGILVHATAAAIGLSALLVASSVTFTVVKVVGASFLVYLGVRTLIDASRRRSSSTLAERLPSTRIASSPFWQGFWSNVLNPKVALLFLSLLPQFLDRGDPIFVKTLFLSSLFLTMGVVWLLAYAALVSRLAGFFRSEHVRRRLEAVSGAVLVALGVRIALQDA